MAITTAGMLAFRSAATLADVLPRARIQVRDGDRTLLTVAPTRPGEATAGPVIPLCRFRAAVARAHRAQQQGGQFQFLNLPPEREPVIDIGLRQGDVVLPGGIYRAKACPGQHLLLFLTHLGVGASDRAVTEATAGSESTILDRLTPQDGGPRHLGFHRDPATQLTVVHALADDADAADAAAVMTRLLEICVAAELIAEMEAAPPPSPKPGP